MSRKNSGEKWIKGGAVTANYAARGARRQFAIRRSKAISITGEREISWFKFATCKRPINPEGGISFLPVAIILGLGTARNDNGTRGTEEGRTMRRPLSLLKMPGDPPPSRAAVAAGPERQTDRREDVSADDDQPAQRAGGQGGREGRRENRSLLPNSCFPFS